MERTKNKFVTALPMIILTFSLIFQFLQLAFGGEWKQELCASAGKIYIQTKTAYSEVLRAIRAYSLPPAWGDGEQTPKIFYTKKEAEKEAGVLTIKYPFIRECRVVTRKEKEKD